MMTTQNLDMALWDTNNRRALVLKDSLDMFSEIKETTLLPLEPEPPLNHHDVVFLSFDESGDPVLRVARTVRQCSETTFILLVSDRNRDLSPCFRPAIRPSGVLFRPVKNAQLRDMLEEIVEELDRLTQTGTDDMFIFKSEGASHRIPFKDILFFEARNKKVVLHTVGQEISYYESIENLVAHLPPYFVRCHRSFMVNANQIESIHGVEMEIKLTGGHRVPYSRSHRDEVRQAMGGKLVVES